MRQRGLLAERVPNPEGDCGNFGISERFGGVYLKIQLVNLCAAEGAAHHPSLTPELLAAVGARYSRSGEGLDAIIGKLDLNDHEGSVAGILKNLDYGHASIADMAPVALFMDGISEYLAYLLWAQCPLAGGQECSTRYLKFSPEGNAHPDEFGIPFELHDEYRSWERASYEAYHRASKLWQHIYDADPSIAAIPAKVAPMRR